MTDTSSLSDHTSRVLSSVSSDMCHRHDMTSVQVTAVHSWWDSFGSTSIWGGAGGQMVTSAVVTVVFLENECTGEPWCAIYINGRIRRTFPRFSSTGNSEMWDRVTQCVATQMLDRKLL